MIFLGKGMAGDQEQLAKPEMSAAEIDRTLIETTEYMNEFDPEKARITLSSGQTELTERLVILERWMTQQLTNKEDVLFLNRLLYQSLCRLKLPYSQEESEQDRLIIFAIVNGYIKKGKKSEILRNLNHWLQQSSSPTVKANLSLMIERIENDQTRASSNTSSR